MEVIIRIPVFDFRNVFGRDYRGKMLSRADIWKKKNAHVRCVGKADNDISEYRDNFTNVDSLWKTKTSLKFVNDENKGNASPVPVVTCSNGKTIHFKLHKRAFYDIGNAKMFLEFIFSSVTPKAPRLSWADVHIITGAFQNIPMKGAPLRKSRFRPHKFKPRDTWNVAKKIAARFAWLNLPRKDYRKEYYASNVCKEECTLLTCGKVFAKRLHLSTVTKWYRGKAECITSGKPLIILQNANIKSIPEDVHQICAVDRKNFTVSVVRERDKNELFSAYYVQATSKTALQEYGYIVARLSKLHAIYECVESLIEAAGTRKYTISNEARNINDIISRISREMSSARKCHDKFSATIKDNLSVNSAERYNDFINDIEDFMAVAQGDMANRILSEGFRNKAKSFFDRLSFKGTLTLAGPGLEVEYQHSRDKRKEQDRLDTYRNTAQWLKEEKERMLNRQYGS